MPALTDFIRSANARVAAFTLDENPGASGEVRLRLQMVLPASYEDSLREELRQFANETPTPSPAPASGNNGNGNGKGKT